MTTDAMPPNVADVPAEAYVVLGLATCFIKEEGKLQPLKVMEPIPSAAFEALCKGIPTSYEMAIATTFGAVWANSQAQVPGAFPGDVQLCEDFEERLLAATRSFRSAPWIQELLPLGQAKTDFNFSTENKRLLNVERVVNTEDNVKQHAYTHQVL
ncbi:MAG: hypothetical protein WCD18_14225 [Thermosynechococcaceae cyanobacterium]